MRKPTPNIKEVPSLLLAYETGRLAFERGTSLTEVQAQAFGSSAMVAGWLDALADKVDRIIVPTTTGR